MWYGLSIKGYKDMSTEQQHNPWRLRNLPEHDLNEEAYMTQHAGLYKEMYAILKKHPRAKVLDIGCATGIAYARLPDREHYEIYGIELVPEFLEVLKERGIHAALCDVNKDNFPFEDEMFDVVICSGIIEHSLAPKHLLNETVRVLKPGGILMLATPNALSATKRWNYFRGRNQFWPLIDNLFNRSYLKRCSIFYSQHELKKILPVSLEISKISFFNEHNPLWNHSFFLRFTKFLPAHMRDVVALFARKKLEKSA